jgi:hypothetical protein
MNKVYSYVSALFMEMIWYVAVILCTPSVQSPHGLSC